jgi:hypothetical protein
MVPTKRELIDIGNHRSLMGSGPCYERISALDHATMPQTDNPREKRLQNNKKKTESAPFSMVPTKQELIDIGNRRFTHGLRTMLYEQKKFVCRSLWWMCEVEHRTNKYNERH